MAASWCVCSITSNDHEPLIAHPGSHDADQDQRGVPRRVIRGTSGTSLAPSGVGVIAHASSRKRALRRGPVDAVHLGDRPHHRAGVLLGGILGLLQVGDDLAQAGPVGPGHRADRLDHGAFPLLAHPRQQQPQRLGGIVRFSDRSTPNENGSSSADSMAAGAASAPSPQVSPRPSLQCRHSPQSGLSSLSRLR